MATSVAASTAATQALTQTVASQTVTQAASSAAQPARTWSDTFNSVVDWTFKVGCVDLRGPFTIKTDGAEADSTLKKMARIFLSLIPLLVFLPFAAAGSLANWVGEKICGGKAAAQGAGGTTASSTASAPVSTSASSTASAPVSTSASSTATDAVSTAADAVSTAADAVSTTPDATA